MPYPPPGHPHYLPDEVREAQANGVAAAARAKYEPKEEPMSTAAAQKYAELRSKIAAARKTMEETAKGLFIELSAELFANNPQLVSYSWTQYTPYFNDGDECVFRCQGDYPTVVIVVDDGVLGYNSNSGELELDGEELESAEDILRQFKNLGGGVDSFSKNGKIYAFDTQANTVTVNGEKIKTYDEHRKVFDGLEKVVGKFLGAFEDEDMKTMFGDHMRVTVHSDGTIETDEYQHD